jgi:hypothetical protein
MRTHLAAALLVSLPLGLASPAAAQRGPDRAPAVGAKAPDFSLERLKSSQDGDQGKVTLSKEVARGPVALIFGSYT